METATKLRKRRRHLAVVILAPVNDSHAVTCPPLLLLLLSMDTICRGCRCRGAKMSLGEWLALPQKSCC